MRAEATGQLRLGQDLVACERGERHLGGGDRPEVVALDVVRLVDELREVAGGDHRLGPHERRRPDLLVEVGAAVERELHERTHQPRPLPAVHHEHRAGHLHGPLDVEDAQLLPDHPVRHALVLLVAGLVVLLDAQHDVVLLAGAVRAVVRGQVRDAQQQLAQLCRDLVRTLVELLLLRAERPALGLELLGLLPSLLAVEGADLVRDHPDLGAQLVAPARQGAELGVEPVHLVHHGGVLAAAGERRLHGVRVVADRSDVQHGAEATRRRRPPRTRAAVGAPVAQRRSSLP